MNKWMLVGLVGLGLLAVSCVVGVYVGHFYSHQIGAPADWALFGDYIGGVANPVLGFVTILLLVISLKYQSDELAATREELSQSREAMQNANVLHNNNIVIQTRNNLRKQLEAHYTGNIKVFYEGVKVEYPIPIDGRAIRFSLQDIMRIQAVRNSNNYVELEVKKLSSEWKGRGVSEVANDVRGNYLRCIEALIALIEYSDSDLTIEFSMKHLEPLTEIMRKSFLYDESEFSLFGEKINLAIKNRKELAFPEFHYKTRAL